jgi:hypothetical protein
MEDIMSFIEDNFKELKHEIEELARLKLGGRLHKAKSDIQKFIQKAGDDFNRWYDLLMAGDLTIEDFIWLVKGKKSLLQLSALTRAGLQLTALERFRDDVLNIIIGMGTRFLV